MLLYKILISNLKANKMVDKENFCNMPHFLLANPSLPVEVENKNL